MYVCVCVYLFTSGAEKKNIIKLSSLCTEMYVTPGSLWACFDIVRV